MSCCCPAGDPAQHTPLTERANVKKQRKCTDCCCCFAFFLCVIVMFIIQLAASTLGDPALLLHGTDYTGATCGVGPMAEKPFTTYPRLGKDLVYQRDKFATAPWTIRLYGLCVESCPSQDQDVMDYPCVTGDAGCLWATNPLVSNDDQNMWHTAVGTSAIMGRCMPVAVTAKQYTELCAYPDCDEAHKPCYTSAFPDQKYWLPADENERGLCERLVELSTSRVSASPESSIESEYIGAFFGGISGTTEQLAMSLFELLAIGVGFATLCNFVLLRVLRTCMAVIFVLTIVAVLLLLVFANVFLFAKAGMIDVGFVTQAAFDPLHRFADFLNISEVSTVVGEADAVAEQAVASNAELFEAVADAQTQTAAYMAWGCLALTCLILVVLAVVSSKLKNALAICATATKPITSMPTLLLLPTLAVVLSVIVVINFLATVVMFLTPDPEEMTAWLLYFTGNVTNAVIDATGHTILDVSEGVSAGNEELLTNVFNSSDPVLGFESFGQELEALDVSLNELPVDPVTLVNVLAGFEVFSCLWILFLIEAVTYTTISGAVSYWYFVASQNDADLADPSDRTKWPVLASLYRCLRFHLGSLAFGAFVLALFSAIRAVLAYIDSKSKDIQESNFMFKLVIQCTRCCLWIFHRIIKFLTKFAFVTIATDGASFCSASFEAFRLTTAHPLQVLANEAAMAVLSLLQLILTPLICAYLAYAAVEGQWRSALFSAYQSADSWSQDLCESYQSEKVDACGYKSSFVGIFGPLAFEDWPPSEKPDALVVAFATLLVSFWVTRNFRDVYAAAVDTIFVCCVRTEDQPVCRPYRKPDVQDTVMHGSSKNLVTGFRSP